MLGIRSLLVFLGIAGFSLAPTMISIAGAEAFRILTQSASAAGQAGAFTAQADDPSAIHYNPAGMTQLHGVQLSFGTLLVGGHTDFVSPAGATARGDFNGSIAYPPPSNFYVTANLKDLGLGSLGNVTAGLGVTSPFGLLTRYANNGPFATAVTFATLPLIDIKPTVAYKLSDQLSFGLGADIYTFTSVLGEGQLELKFAAPPGGAIPPGTPLELNGNDTAVGFNVSMLYTPLRNGDGKPLVNIGLLYRSQATLHLTGQFLVNGAPTSDARSTLVLPQVFTGGIAVWPVRNREREWKLEMDVDYVGWKSFRNLDVSLSTGGTLPFPQEWRNNVVVMIGTEHRWLKVDRLPDWELAVRAGYWHSQTPVPDRNFTPAVPDADNHTIAVGLGLLCKEKASFFGLIPCSGLGIGAMRTTGMGLDLSYQTVLYESRTVSGNRNPTVDGLYQTALHVGAVNLRVNF